MKPRTFFVLLLQLGLAGTVLLLSHYRYVWLAALVVLVPVGVAWLRAGRQTPALIAGIPTAIAGLSIVILVGLSKPPLGQKVFPVVTQVVLTLLYAGWLAWLRRLRIAGQATLWALATITLAAVTAIFLAEAFWHWPEALVIATTGVAMMASAFWYLSVNGERVATLVAVAWGLVAAEIAWMLSIWQVNYIIGSSGYVIIPQATLIILGTGYCFASIYSSHREKRLSRHRLIEYVVIAGVLFAIVIGGTHWNGTI